MHEEVGRVAARVYVFHRLINSALSCVDPAQMFAVLSANFVSPTSLHSGLTVNTTIAAEGTWQEHESKRFEKSEYPHVSNWPVIKKPKTTLASCSDANSAKMAARCTLKQATSHVKIGGNAYTK
jgi:hypothetical protein